MANIEIKQQNGHDFLWIDKGDGEKLWMWDIEEEALAQKQIADMAYGDVLVAGYGLGVVQKFLGENPRVNSVLSVEISSEVIWVNRSAKRKIQGDFIISDFYDYGDNGHKRDFDCVVGDLWKDMTPEKEDLDEYLKFREKALSLLKPGGKVLGWGLGYFEYLLKEKPDEEILNSITKNGN